MEASLNKLWSCAGCQEFVCASKTCPEDTFCLYLISSLDEVMVSRLVRPAWRARSARQRVSFIQ
jgi:hypothetical protein